METIKFCRCSHKISLGKHKSDLGLPGYYLHPHDALEAQCSSEDLPLFALQHAVQEPMVQSTCEPRKEIRCCTWEGARGKSFFATPCSPLAAELLSRPFQRLRRAAAVLEMRGKLNRSAPHVAVREPVRCPQEAMCWRGAGVLVLLRFGDQGLGCLFCACAPIRCYSAGA